MAFTVSAHTLGGDTYCIGARGDDTISQLHKKTAAIVGRSDFKLTTAAGYALQPPGALLGVFGICEGSMVQIVFQPLRVVGTHKGGAIVAVVSAGVREGGAFVAVKGDGTVVTWGSPQHGGDSSAVRALLGEVKEIYPTRGAFAAVNGDGTVGTFKLCSSSPMRQLKRPVELFALGYVLDDRNPPNQPKITKNTRGHPKQQKITKSAPGPPNGVPGPPSNMVSRRSKQRIITKTTPGPPNHN